MNKLKQFICQHKCTVIWGILEQKNDDECIDKKTVLNFNQTLENFLKVSVGNDVYNLTKYEKIQITVITKNKTGNGGQNVLHKVSVRCFDEK